MAVFGSILSLAPTYQLYWRTAEIIAAVSNVDNVAFAIYLVSSDPHNAPLVIILAIFKQWALLDVSKVAKTASIRREMSTADIAKLDNQIKSITMRYS
jgi:hypothetical protein